MSSLELAIEAVGLLGTCALGYSCAYNNTISWRTPTTPLPMENNPRPVFERLFGASDSTDAETRLRLIHKHRSILDSVNDKVARLQKRVGKSDQLKVTEYLDSVRDVERWIEKAEEQVDQELPVVERPMGIPGTFEEHARLMFDLLLLAYQTDLTRVSTFLLTREASVRPYPEIGVPEPYHPLSHHQEDPEKLAKQAKVNVFHLKQFAYFLERMRQTPDGDGSLLDHTLMLYGSGMSDSNMHLPYNVPTMVVGGSLFDIKAGRHIQATDSTPLTNLQLTLMERMGARMEPLRRQHRGTLVVDRG